ncbi:NHL repeat-containing 2-like [Octopus vulgaris]|uniref:NHL repeat-containing 2-like n=1 Tax=Octopus vulgaris TaxID=6645 RepID=A0AA36EXQ6_OCTVU|nr:NHL repeat-containing 2-like [Octopus vulgaris]
MGNRQSSMPVRRRHPSGSEIRSGFSSLKRITGKNYYFENLVLEGNNVKSLAYVGALKVLDKVGILGKLKRFAGVGTSGVIASLLAADFDCDTVQRLLNEHIDNLLFDNQCDVLAKDVMEKLGRNSGRKFLEWFGNILRIKFGNADITFSQLYDQTGKELCIVVMNLSRRCEEYFHVKTTPDAVIRRAVLMTISFPGMFQPVKYHVDGQESYYLDGGIICNYPINCFDGWWLSMESKNNFVDQCCSAADITTFYKGRFLGKNYATLGILLYDNSHYTEEYCIVKQQLNMAKANSLIPNTKLGRQFKDASEISMLQMDVFERFSDSNEQFCMLLDSLKDCDDAVEINTLAKVLSSNECLSATEKEVLFGTAMISEAECAEFLNKISNGNDMLAVSDMENLLESKNWALYSQCLCSEKIEITNHFCYWGVIANVLHSGTSKVLKDNLDRTVGVYTGYIDNSTLHLEEADECYLIQQGWNCTVSYLRQLTM